jgi:hypothetical protein
MAGLGGIRPASPTNKSIIVFLTTKVSTFQSRWRGVSLKVRIAIRRAKNITVLQNYEKGIASAYAIMP